MHNVNSSFYDDDCKEEEIYDNSSGPSSSDKYECVTMPVVEVLYEEEDLRDNQNSNFLEYMINESIVVNVSSYSDNDLI